MVKKKSALASLRLTRASGATVGLFRRSAPTATAAVDLLTRRVRPFRLSSDSAIRSFPVPCAPSFSRYPVETVSQTKIKKITNTKPLFKLIIKKI